jgi:proline-rich protein PRCC
MAPGQRAELTAMRSALGDDYEARLKSDASKVGNVSKTAKRKHQLSSLYVQSKEQELEDMEKRATGAKTKSETQRKYGW